MTKHEVHDLIDGLTRHDPRSIGRAISTVENNSSSAPDILAALDNSSYSSCLIIGITGPPGAGKSTLTSRLTEILRTQGVRVGIIAIDPSSPISGGALLGDRVRMMNHSLDPDVVVRSMANRGRLGGLCSSAGGVLRIMAASGCTVILIETVGIGQSEMDVISLADLTVMVLAPGFGDDIQAMKAGILEVADLIVINKADHPGADQLVLDIQANGRDNIGEYILTTSARNGEGVPELVAKIQSLAEAYRKNGTFSQRRQHAFEQETLDRALEIIRPRIATALLQQNDIQTPPAIMAETLIKSLFHPDKHDTE